MPEYLSITVLDARTMTNVMIKVLGLAEVFFQIVKMTVM
jgi:hypothetical protein